MKNIIEFYYNITDIQLHSRSNYYFFNVGKKEFVFRPYSDSENRAISAYKVATLLDGKIEVDSIILNRYNTPLSRVQDIPYILMEKRNSMPLSLAGISNISNIRFFDMSYIKELERNNWEILWENKIDYYERQINENKKKYPLVRESFDYFIGMGENAISYLVNTKLEVDPTLWDEKVLSHNNLNSSIYDPLNIILDHKARDVAEYIKFYFWNEGKGNIFELLDEYFNYNYYSIYGMRVLFARILYPSFYFDKYDLIITGKIPERELNAIINRVFEYEEYLYHIYLYLRKFSDIPLPEWLNKRGV